MAVLRCHEFLRSAQFRVLSLANRAKKCSAKDAVIQQSWITKPNKGFWCKHLVEAPQKCSDLTAQILPKSKNVLSSWCSDLQKFRKVLRFKCSDIPQKSKKCSDLVLRWCSDRAEQKKHCARNPLLANLSSPLFSCTSVLAACCSVIAAYCSLLATSLMVLLASRSSTYASPRILFLNAIHLPSCQFSLKILVTRRLLHDFCCTLLPLCYWQLASHCYLFAVCSPITAWLLLLAGWTPSFSLKAPLPVNIKFAQCLPHANRY